MEQVAHHPLRLLPPNTLHLPVVFQVRLSVADLMTTGLACVTLDQVIRLRRLAIQMEEYNGYEESTSLRDSLDYLERVVKSYSGATGG